MATITQTIPKHPTDPDQTLDAVLEDVVQRNALNRKLVGFVIKPKEVVLAYEPVV